MRLTVAAETDGTLGRAAHVTVGGKELVLVDVSGDGCWVKASTSNHFDSSAGAQAIYGRLTRLPIAWNTFGRNCAKCDVAKRLIRRDRANSRSAGGSGSGSGSDSGRGSAPTAIMAADASGGDSSAGLSGGESSAAYSSAFGSSAVSVADLDLDESDGEVGGYVGGGLALDSDSDGGSGGGSSIQLTAVSIGEMKIPELKEKLKGLGLNLGGKKAALAGRLRDHFGLIEEEEQDEVAEIDEFAGDYPLHAVGSCAATWTHNGEVGALGGQKLKATTAGLMESRGIAKMMAKLPERGAAVGRFCGDDDNKLVAHLRDGGISQELYALMDKDADPNHRLASCSATRAPRSATALRAPRPALRAPRSAHRAPRPAHRVPRTALRAPSCRTHTHTPSPARYPLERRTWLLLALPWQQTVFPGRKMVLMCLAARARSS